MRVLIQAKTYLQEIATHSDQYVARQTPDLGMTLNFSDLIIHLDAYDLRIIRRAAAEPIEVRRGIEEERGQGGGKEESE